MKRTTLAAAAAAALVAWAPALCAQQVDVRGRGDPDNDAFLRSFVARGDYHLIARDTLIARTDTVRGNALVLRGTLRLDGVVAGDLVIVDANVFMRPSARVLGTVHNVGGGLYPSELAVVEGSTRSEPNAAYIVEERGGRYIILGTTRPSLFVRPGLYGFGVPSYDRVDGVALSYSAGLLLPRVERIEPILRGRVDYRSQRGAFTGGVELGLPRGGTEFVAGAERTTLTNEAWIREALENSVSFLFLGKDNRDYYEADRGYVELRRQLESGTRTTSAYLRAQVEEARTLSAGSPWTLFGSPRQDNTGVDDGRISSLLAGAELDWEHPLHVVGVTARAEAAGRTLRGEHAFGAYVLDLDWALSALADHTLRTQLHAQGPLPGTDSLPRQRWSFVGGSGTLPTFPFAEFRGDRVILVETRYSIPVPQLRLRLLGTPELDLLHIAGMAWSSDDRRALEQNFGFRFRYSVANVRILTNPAAFWDERKISFGLNVPRRAYPWTRRPEDR